MQISTSRLFDRAAYQMGALSSRADTLQTQIATGKRLQAPSDDAVAFRKLEALRLAEADDGVFGANLKVAGGVLAQADSALEGITNQLQRASELAIKAANGTMGPVDRKLIGVEVADIVEALAQLANRTDPRGVPLFGDAEGGPAAVRQPDGSFVLAATSPSPIPIGEGQSLQASEPASRIFGLEGKNGPTDAFAVVAALAAALQGEGDPSEAIATAVDDLNGALDQTAAMQASLGARGARVDMADAQLKQAAVDREEARGGLEDADITATVTELQKTITILQATQASFSKLSGLSLFDYLR